VPAEVIEISTKSALVRSKLPGVDYVINPYLGCGHGCGYCYAAFMSKYSRAGHADARWGSFVEVKANIADVLAAELGRKREVGGVLMSSVCDPYQPAERRYKLTRRCLELLLGSGWRVDILTRSPLVFRDVDLLASPRVSVGLSLPTDDDRVRRALEPEAPPIGSRLAVLKKLKEAGVDTWAFIGPLLPMNARALYEALNPLVDHVLIDPLNYRGRFEGLLRRHGLEEALTDEFARRTAGELKRLFGSKARSAGGDG